MYFPIFEKLWPSMSTSDIFDSSILYKIQAWIITVAKMSITWKVAAIALRMMTKSKEWLQGDHCCFGSLIYPFGIVSPGIFCRVDHMRHLIWELIPIICLTFRWRQRNAFFGVGIDPFRVRYQSNGAESQKLLIYLWAKANQIFV